MTSVFASTRLSGSSVTQTRRLSRLVRACGGILVSTVLLCAACGQESSPAAPTPAATAPPGKVTITADVRNSDGTLLGRTAFYAQPGDNLTVTVDELAARGIDTHAIDRGFLVARTPNQGGFMGSFIASNWGSFPLTIKVSDSRNIVVWGLNTSNRADYPTAFAYGLGGRPDAYTSRQPFRTQLRVSMFPTGMDVLTLWSGRSVTTVDASDVPLRRATDMFNKAMSIADGLTLMRASWGAGDGMAVRVGWFEGYGLGSTGFVVGNDGFVIHKNTITNGTAELYAYAYMADMLEIRRRPEWTPILTLTTDGAPSAVGYDYLRAHALFAAF